MRNRIVCLRALFLSSLFLLFVALVFGTFLTGEAFAQVRPAIVRDIDNGDRQQIYEGEVTVVQTDGLRGSDECTADAVPAGKRLVIEHVTARVHLPVGQTAYAGLKTSFLHFATFLPLVPQETRAGYTDYVSAVSARLRIPAGGRACVWLDRNEGDGSATGQFWISGYLVDAP